MAQELELFTADRVRDELVDQLTKIISALGDNAKEIKRLVETGGLAEGGIWMPTNAPRLVKTLGAWQRRLGERLIRVNEGTILELNRQRIRKQMSRQEKPIPKPAKKK